MTNKKFKKAAMALALTACVAATPLAANAETPDNAADVQAPAAVDHTEADTQEAPEAELPVAEEPEAQPAAEAAAQPAAPEATPIAVELPTAEETPEDEETPEEKEETPVEVTPTEDAVVEKETPAKVAPAPAAAKANADIPMEDPDADILIEDPDADIATMDGAENAVSDEHEAKIGDTSYGTLDEALKNAQVGNEVVLQKDHKGNIKITEWIKLNLNGKKIEGNVDVDLSGKKDDAATTQDGETAANKNTVEITGGTITGATDSGVTIKDAGDTNVLLKDLTIEDNKGTQGGGVHIENSQNVTIDHCIIRDNKTTEVSPNNNASVDIGAGGGVFVSSNSHVTIQNDSTIQNNTGTRGGGVYAEYSTVEVKKSTIQGNIATDDIIVTVDGKDINENLGDGGGVYTTHSTVHVSNSTIQKNTAHGLGGGGICARDSSLDVKDSSISHNTANHGGGLDLTDCSNATLESTSIENNSATGFGGGVRAYDCGVITAKNCSISNNHAKLEGGGLDLSDCDNATLENASIKNNSTSGLNDHEFGGGGGVYASNVTLKVINSDVSDNTATSQGGGLSLYDSKLTAKGNTIANNEARDGGGIVLNTSSADLEGNTITGNKATEVGGGVYAYVRSGKGNAVLTLKGNTITKNEADLIGGGVHIENSQDVTIDHCIIRDNKTTEVSKNGSDVSVGAGGGVFVSNNSNVTITDSEIRNNTGTRGGGIYVDNSIVEVEDSTIDNNTANDVPSDSPTSNKGVGGGIYSFDSTLTVTDSTISNNTAKGHNGIFKYNSSGRLSSAGFGKGGGGICAVGKKSDVTLDGVTVTGNKAIYSDSSNNGVGGGINAQGGKLTVTDSSTISNNNARGNGGGIASEEGNVLNVSDSTVQGNTGNNGGGIHFGERNEKTAPTTATITDTKILDNESIGSQGGGVYVATKSTAILKDCTVAGNKTTSMGGGICGSLASITLDNVQVENNKATSASGMGGGVFLQGIAVPGSLTLQNGSIIRNNTASSMGGGLFLYGNVGLKSENSEISGNKALYGAGIAASQYLANFASPKLELVDTKVNNNGDASTVMGGGIYAASGVTVTSKNTKFLGNTANTAGGILLYLNSSADLNNSEVSSNTATGNGGGVYVYDATCSLTASNGTVFRENTAASGGAIQNGGTLTVEDGVIISGNTATEFGGGILNNGVLTLKKGTSLVENSAGLYGGGLCSSGTVEVESGAKLYNNHAAQAGDDVYLFGKGSTLTLTKVGDDWMLDDCGHKINGWFADLLDARWDADGKQEHVINLKDYKADGLTIVENEDGSYTITILDENATLALKAAHNVTPKPTPDPDPEPTPDPDTPDTPVSPEGPTTPPVQDATPDEAETPVTPENPANPSVQDATPDAVAALPKTGVNWFTALAMALSGMALMAAGAFTSLFAKSKH